VLNQAHIQTILALALEGMRRDGQITTEQALHLAHLALHDNFQALYGL
jgi:hypothetical protein